MDVLPRDVIFSICQWLPLTLLFRFERTCKKYQKICNDPQLYDRYLTQLMVKKKTPSPSCKQDVIDFMNGKALLHSEDGYFNDRFLHIMVAKIIGIDAFMNLPILDLGPKSGHTSYIDFVRNKDMLAPVMKGIDCFSRPFIAIRYINRQHNVTQTMVIFHRYTEGYTLVMGTCYPKICFRQNCMGKRDLNYFERLLLHKPCGNHKERINYSANDSDTEEEIKTLPDGQSIVELI